MKKILLFKKGGDPLNFVEEGIAAKDASRRQEGQETSYVIPFVNLKNQTY